MGAAGLTTDRDVMDRLQAYINIEATGNDGGAMLFETGPANCWIAPAVVAPGAAPARRVVRDRDLQRLPNDTDFSILKRHDLPGLNFAAVGDSYPYHTARDTPERLTRSRARAKPARTSSRRRSRSTRSTCARATP